MSKKPYSPFDRVPGPIQISVEDAEYLKGTPAPLKITIPVSIFNSVSQEEIEKRFSKDLVKFLYEEAKDAGLENVTEEETNWFLNDKDEVWVVIRGKNFFHDYETCEYGWRIGK